MEIHTTIKDFASQIAPLKISPDTPIKVIIPESAEGDTFSEHLKGKWARVAEDIAGMKLLDRKSAKELQKASKEFRDNFCFREQSCFEGTENES